MRACWTTRICILMMYHCCGARCRIFWKENRIRRRNFAFRSGTGVICGAVCVRRWQKDRAGEPAKAVGVILDIDAEKREAQRMRERVQSATP